MDELNAEIASALVKILFIILKSIESVILVLNAMTQSQIYAKCTQSIVHLLGVDELNSEIASALVERSVGSDGNDHLGVCDACFSFKRIKKKKRKRRKKEQHWH